GVQVVDRPCHAIAGICQKTRIRGKDLSQLTHEPLRLDGSSVGGVLQCFIEMEIKCRIDIPVYDVCCIGVLSMDVCCMGYPLHTTAVCASLHMMSADVC